MGTAVLLPQDCLATSKSRQEPNLSDVLNGSSSPPRMRGGTLQDLDPHFFSANQSRGKFNLTERVGLSAAPGCLPLPENGKASVKTQCLQREVDGKKTKARRSVQGRDPKFFSKSGLDAPVITILQRPKDKDLANELITKFLGKVDESKRPVWLPDWKSDTKGFECKSWSRTKSDTKSNERRLESGTQNTFLDLKNGVSNFRKRIAVLVEERPELQDSKLDVSKPDSSGLSSNVDLPTPKDSKVERGKYQGSSNSVSKRIGFNGFDDLISVKGLNQMLTLKLTGKCKNLRTAGAAENFSCKLSHSNRPARLDNIVGVGVAQLRRAATDPQIMNHLVGQYRSEVMEIPYSNARPSHGISRSCSLSCPERWAGPAYSSSPAPSSLPLPKFSLVSQKISSPDLSSPLAGRIKTKITQHPESGSLRSLPGASQGGELDVASATRSLRRMLKLEPL